MLVDSHCHIYFPELKNQLSEVLAKMKAAGVRSALVVSVGKSSFAQLLPIVDAHMGLFASVGTHPQEEKSEGFSLTDLMKATNDPKVIALGETGLDYHYPEGIPKPLQKERFALHIKVAEKTGLPLIIHTRDADQECLDCMEPYNLRAVIHCFTEDRAFAKRALDLGYYLSFSGIVTFKSAYEIQEVVRYAPEERILIETDSPFLAPVPKRGKINEPAFVTYTAQFIAQLRGESLEKVHNYTTRNFYALFNKADENQVLF